MAGDAQRQLVSLCEMVMWEAVRNFEASTSKSEATRRGDAVEEIWRAAIDCEITLLGTRHDFTEEAVRGEINLFAGGMTWVDREYLSLEPIDPSHFDSRHIFAWESSSLILKSGCAGTKFEDVCIEFVNFERWQQEKHLKDNHGQLHRTAGEGTDVDSKLPKLEQHLANNFMRQRKKDWPAGKPYPSEVDDWQALRANFPFRSVPREVMRGARSILGTAWIKQGPKLKRSSTGNM